MLPQQGPGYERPADWQKARGLWMLHYNGLTLLARASVEATAGAIAEDAELWERDVLQRAVIMRRDSLFVFRLRGHAWSVVVQNPYARTPYGHIGHEWEKSLSRRLQQPLIEYGVSDTCGSIGYTLISGDEVVEDFYAEEGEEGRPDLKESYFRSRRRDLSLNKIDDIYGFVCRFFVEQDAFDPALEFGYFFDGHPPKPGESGVVGNPGHLIVGMTFKRCRR